MYLTIIRVVLLSLCIICVTGNATIIQLLNIICFDNCLNHGGIPSWSNSRNCIWSKDENAGCSVASDLKYSCSHPIPMMVVVVLLCKTYERPLTTGVWHNVNWTKCNIYTVATLYQF